MQFNQQEMQNKKKQEQVLSLTAFYELGRKIRVEDYCKFFPEPQKDDLSPHSQ